MISVRDFSRASDIQLNVLLKQTCVKHLNLTHLNVCKNSPIVVRTSRITNVLLKKFKYNRIYSFCFFLYLFNSFSVSNSRSIFFLCFFSSSAFIEKCIVAKNIKPKITAAIDSIGLKVKI